MNNSCQRCQSFYESYPLQDGHHLLNAGYSMAPATCAFPDGTFTPENWNCQTMIALRDMAERDHYGFRAWHNDVSLGVLPVPESEDEDAQEGYLIMTWYKDRGKTSQAFVVSDDDGPQVLMLKTAERIIDKATRP